MEQPTLERDWLWWLRLLGVAYIALIGIFAIEELNGRNETMRLLLAEEAKVGTAAAAKSAGDASEKLATLERARQKLVVLMVSGAEDQGTLRDIHRELALSQANKPPANAESSNARLDAAGSWLVAVFSCLLLKNLSAVAGSGQILGVLIVTASVGGALVTLSLRQTREGALRTVIRAIGGGIVCYLAVDGGTIPISPTDVAVTTHAATASLYGFLAGMFSERVFRLLSDLVDAFLARITPGLKQELGGATAQTTTAHEKVRPA